MSCAKEGYNPCFYREVSKDSKDDNTFFCRKLKKNISYPLCGHGKCSDFLEDSDDYDWRDHWC